MWPFRRVKDVAPPKPTPFFSPAMSKQELLALADSSLVVALLERIRPPHRAPPEWAWLNETERVLTALFDLDGYVIGEGFDAWLMYAGHEAILATPAYLELIGAPEVAVLVRRVLAEFGPSGPAPDADDLATLAPSSFALFGECGKEYGRLYESMWQRLGAFARLHIEDVRVR